MPSNLAKYSGLLEPHQENILSKFLESHNVSKAKVIGLLLEDWEKNNYPKFEDSDRPVKLSELSAIVNQLIEEKLNNLNIPNLVKNQVSIVSYEVSKEVNREVNNLNQLTFLTTNNEVSYEVANLSKNGKGSNEVSNGVNNLTANVSNETANQDDNLEHETRIDDINPYVKSLGKHIDVKAVAVDEKPKTETKTAKPTTVTESQATNEDNEQLPSNIELESSKNDEGIKAPETENDEVKSDSARAKKEDKLSPEERIEIIKAIPIDETLTVKDIEEKIGVSNSQLSMKKYKNLYITPYFTVSKDGNKNIYTRS